MQSSNAMNLIEMSGHFEKYIIIRQLEQKQNENNLNIKYL